MDRDELARLALAVAVGAAGGLCFDLADLPAPWISGAMVAVAVAVLSGLKARVDRRLRSGLFLFLGTSMGAGVTPDVLAGIGVWPASLVLLATTVLATGAATHLFLRRLLGWDGASAFFASIPGALSYVLVLAETSQADVPKVALSQTVRVFILVALLPSVVAALEAAPTASGPVAAGIVALQENASLADLVLMLLAGLAGGLAGERVGLPAGSLVGAFAASAVLHGAGLVTGVLPAPLLAIGYVCLGTFIGLRFSGTRWIDLARGLASAVGAFVVGGGVALAGAAAAALLLDLPFGQSIIAFAPGGLEAMMILAFTLGFDPAYVAVHQLSRFLVMMIAVPALARLVLGRDWNGRGR